MTAFSLLNSYLVLTFVKFSFRQFYHFTLYFHHSLKKYFWLLPQCYGPVLNTWHIHLCGFQIPHGVKQCRMCQCINLNCFSHMIYTHKLVRAKTLQNFWFNLVPLEKNLLKQKIRGSLNKFPAFFLMGTFIDSTHMKL